MTMWQSRSTGRCKSGNGKTRIRKVGSEGPGMGHRATMHPPIFFRNSKLQIRLRHAEKLVQFEGPKYAPPQKLAGTLRFLTSRRRIDRNQPHCLR